MSTILDAPETPSAPPPRSSTPAWIIAAVAALGLALGFVIYAHLATRKALEAQIQDSGERLAKVQARAAKLEDGYANLKAQLDVTVERLGLTQDELDKAHRAAQQIKKEQRQSAEDLGTQIEQQRAELGALSTEVSGVKGEVAATKQELQRAIGDLGVQSGLIARNRDDLEELKRRGERDYFDFDVKKAKTFARVGAVGLRLDKVDQKRNKYTLVVKADDKDIEKRDKTLLEPVQFYLQGTRKMLELVVFTLEKDRVVGYLSAPKDTGKPERAAQ